MLKTILAAAIGLHGLGMIGGVYFVFATKSWLARLVPGGGVTLSVVVAALWVVSGVLLVGGAWGLYSGAAWVRSWLIAGSSLSLIAIALWAGEIPAGTYVGGALMFGVLLWQLFFPEAL